MADQIVNLANVQTSALCLRLEVSRAQNSVERIVTAKRAVYANGNGLVSRVADLPDATTVLTISEDISAIVMSIKGSPVSITAKKPDDTLITFTVDRLLVWDQPLKNIQLQSTGVSKVDIQYQN